MFSNLFSDIKITESKQKIVYQSKLMFVGSCFSNNIALKFQNLKFDTLVNPNGIIYNPQSIKLCFENIFSQKQYKAGDFFSFFDRFYSFDYHSDYSDVDLDLLINRINSSIKSNLQFLKTVDFVFITPSTSIVYLLKENQKIVANCHKQSEKIFEKKQLSLQEIIDCLSFVAKGINDINPKAKIIFTLSPIRHLKDGLHQNQISKSLILLAIDDVIKNYNNCDYFPSYEIVLDVLRDYRFYQEDLMHLTSFAENIVFDYFKNCYFSNKTKNDVNLVEKFLKTTSHKIIDPYSNQTLVFAKAQLQNAQNLENQIIGLNLEEEKKYFEKIIQKNLLNKN